MRFVNPPQVEGHVHLQQLPQDEGMPYTPLTKRAMDLSFEVHKDQRDKSGRPYVYHPFHLADHMHTEEATCVALLHDTVEDGDVTPDDLRDMGFPNSVVDAITALTHDPSVPYLDYVLGLRDQPLAREVKLADLRHNSNLSRLDQVNDRDRTRRLKYLMAQALLDDRADTFDPAHVPPVCCKRMPLDDEGRCSWSFFYTTQGDVVSCSLDMEASEEHYCLDASEIPALWQALNPQAPSFVTALGGTVLRHGAGALLNTLRTCGIAYCVHR
ncbi:MAG: hypothetical protein Q4A01_06075 [Coriobacteriales bacterium]|nr:hypothetical protein [Coriobacteriales bacterium]